MAINDLPLGDRFDEDLDFPIDVETQNCGSVNWSFLLVSRCFSPRKIAAATISKSLSVAWNLRRDLEVKHYNDMLFLIQLSSAAEIHIALNCGPWLIKQCLIALQPWHPTIPPQQLRFMELDIWMHIYNLPLNLYNHKAISRIVGKIGKLHTVRLSKSVKDLSRSIAVRVSLPIELPLRPGLRLTCDGRNPVWIEFVYAKLPYFCLFCGIIGHDSKSCPSATAETQMSAQGRPPIFHSLPDSSRRQCFEVQFGNWLRLGEYSARPSTTNQLRLFAKAMIIEHEIQFHERPFPQDPLRLCALVESYIHSTDELARQHMLPQVNSYLWGTQNGQESFILARASSVGKDHHRTMALSWGLQ